jgi:hypothetical protein
MRNTHSGNVLVKEFGDLLSNVAPAPLSLATENSDVFILMNGPDNVPLTWSTHAQKTVLFAILAAAEMYQPQLHHQLDQLGHHPPQPQVLAAVHASAFLAFNGPATHAQITVVDQTDSPVNSLKLCKCKRDCLLILTMILYKLSFYPQIYNCWH